MNGFAPAADIGLAEYRLSAVLSVLVTLIVCVWIAASESLARYALYALPVLMVLSCAMTMHWRIAVDRGCILALAIYATVALLAVMHNPYAGTLATRDLLIISGYLLVFVIAIRAPRFLADACLASLFVATVIVALKQGVSLNVDLLSSGGILESSLAFPLGLVFLYYTGTRQWGRAMLAFVLLFLAFKRIAFVGVAGALVLELAVVLFAGSRFTRLASVMAVAVLSVAALFSIQIFDFMAALLHNENMSANAISLGRAEFAAALWRDLHTGGLGHALLGFGPGAADLAVARSAGDFNPHNDWLKILYDYGIVGFLGFHAVLYLVHPRTAFGNRAYVYLAIAMMTDNLMIYLFYFVYLFLLMRIVDPQAGHGR